MFRFGFLSGAILYSSFGSGDVSGFLFQKCRGIGGVPLFNHLQIYVVMYPKTKFDCPISSGPVLKWSYGNI